MPPQRATEPFHYQSFEIDPVTSTLTCRYELGRHRFAEQFVFERDAQWDSPGVEAAARLVFLLAGISYFKTGAPATVDLGDTATTPDERALLVACIRRGLGEFAYRNELDLSDVQLTGPERTARTSTASSDLELSRPLVPFGGGIDSIVTAESVRRTHSDCALFVVSRPGDRFAAIEAPAAVAALRVRRVGRAIDRQLLESDELDFLNGHVPVTGILSAVAVLDAVLSGRGAVVMSNEWSSSVPTNTPRGAVNHQWSKGSEFEELFRLAIRAAGQPLPDYFSYLRARSELWVAQRFAALAEYLPVFRSCNRSFTLDPERRLDHWCGICDKCCFIDLILAPFVATADLESVFDGREPLGDDSLADTFRTLLDLGAEPKPFECVGDAIECRAAVLLAADRPDRKATTLLQTLADEIRTAGFHLGASGRALFETLGEDHVPDAYAPDDQLV